MADPSDQKPGLTIPDDVRAKFPDVVDLIVKSESMNDEERQYWINILLVMTPEQLQSLRDILENEKKQLAAIDAKYQPEIDQVGQQEFLKKADTQRRSQREKRQGAEAEHRKQEEQATEDILKQIENPGSPQ